MVKAVLFDLDGTLLHTLPDLNACMNKMLEHFHFPQITLAQTRLFVGHGGQEFVRMALPPDQKDMAEECFAYYSAMHGQWKNELTTQFEGEKEFFADLKARGVKCALVTNKGLPATKNLCDTLLKDYRFDEVLANGSGYPVKPDPAGTLAVLEKLGVTPREGVFVGDGDTDVQTAKNAGMKCVSVLWGYRTEQELRAAGAAIFARTFQELTQKIFG